VSRPRALGKRFRSWFLTPPDFSRAGVMRELAWAFWTAPSLFGLILIVMAIDEPSVIAGAWQLYLIFVVAPAVIGAAFWRCARRLDRRE
jgi:hypothetical protein